MVRSLRKCHFYPEPFFIHLFHEIAMLSLSCFGNVLASGKKQTVGFDFVLINIFFRIKKAFVFLNCLSQEFFWFFLFVSCLSLRLPTELSVRRSVCAAERFLFSPTFFAFLQRGRPRSVCRCYDTKCVTISYRLVTYKLTNR